jgi:putative tryptophan/tyrosine transport system substrate-binding protein
MTDISRRKFIVAVGTAAVTRPSTTHAQQPTMPVIGFLGNASAERWARRVRAFQQGLSEAGYVEGQNVSIVYRWAEGKNDRLPGLAADLVRQNVTLIAAPGSTPAVLAAKAATSTIPVVFAMGSDPIAIGLVASLSRPGGNVTGATTLSVELGPKRLELMHELVPTATSMALLLNPSNPVVADAESTSVQAAARRLGVQIHILYASADSDFDAVFAKLVQLGAAALMIGPDTFFTSRSEQLAELALQHSVPTIYWVPEFAAAGGLMTYGGSLTDAFRQAGVYAGRIIKGERPADLPVQQSTKVELIVNLKAAKTLGLTVPQTLLVAAEEVIE